MRPPAIYALTIHKLPGRVPDTDRFVPVDEVRVAGDSRKMLKAIQRSYQVMATEGDKSQPYLVAPASPEAARQMPYEVADLPPSILTDRHSEQRVEVLVVAVQPPQIQPAARAASRPSAELLAPLVTGREFEVAQLQDQ